jgi:tetratricopeptide (TPR) repeat protein
MRCWTCGNQVNTISFRCPLCKTNKGIKRLTEIVSSQATDEAVRYRDLERELQHYFNELTDTVSDGLSNIATAVEWGFRGLSWRVEQQTEVLRSIDQTLKTPKQTEANEYRQQAEEAQRLGALDVAQERYERALDANPLDYRTYIGLAETLLQKENFERARLLLEESLWFAPKGKIDYKSYSLRLTGHIHACMEDYGTAAEALRKATELSPAYADAHYDYAQYCAQTGEIQRCLDSLARAVDAKPLYWSLAIREPNFGPARAAVSELLMKVYDEAAREARAAFDELAAVYEAISRTCSSMPPLSHTYASERWETAEPRCEAAINSLRELGEKRNLYSQRELTRTLPEAAAKLRSEVRSGPLSAAERERVSLGEEAARLKQSMKEYGLLGGLGCLSLILFVIVWWNWGWNWASAAIILSLIASFAADRVEKWSISKKLRAVEAESETLCTGTITPLQDALKRLDVLNPPTEVQLMPPTRNFNTVNAPRHTRT